MKILKYLVYTLIVLIMITLATAAVLPKTFKAEGVSVINKPSGEVYNYVKQIKTQENYAVWFQKDPDMVKNYYGTDGTIGSGLKWQSKKVGDGEQVITGLVEGRRVNIDLFLNGSKDAAKFNFTVDSIAPHQTKVKQAVEGAVPYPFNVMMLFYNMDADFQKNADHLKQVLEANKAL